MSEYYEQEKASGKTMAHHEHGPRGTFAMPIYQTYSADKCAFSIDKSVPVSLAGKLVTRKMK